MRTMRRRRPLSTRAGAAALGAGRRLLRLGILMVAACAPRVVDGLCGGTPCLVLGECSATAVSWLWDSESIDGRPASNMQIKSNPVRTAAHVSCPGTTSPTSPSGQCHMWGAEGWSSDRNDLLQIVRGAGDAIQIHSFPATKSAPIGKGLLNPGMCLTADRTASSGASVYMGEVGPKCLNFRTPPCGGKNPYRRCGGVLRTVPTRERAGTSVVACLTIDAIPPPPPGPPCWYLNSSVHNATMCDPTALPLERAKDLVGRMTVEEKGHNMGGDGGWGGSAGVPRLGATSSCLAGRKKGLLDSSEALHGLGQAGCGATTYHPEFGGNNTGCPASFPHALALGSTFNRTLFGLIGDRISTEARSAWNIGKEFALWLWAPDINLFKDPRWGRGQEVPGEDPFLNGEYAMRWIHAFQYGLDGGAQIYKAMPSAKHAMAYDLENWGGLSRASFNAIISDRDLVEYYYPAWRAAIQGGRAGSVMCSYNAVNGVPSCANGEFLNSVLRDQYGFDGLVVSDCGAIDHMHSQFKPGDPSTTGGNQSGVMKPGFPTNSSDSTMLAGVSGGCDADCPGGNPPVTYFGGIAHAIKSGRLPVDLVDRSLIRIFTAAISLGLLDDPSKSPYAHLSDKDLDTPDTRRLNLEAALQSMVLLKNVPIAGGNPVLPIAKGSKVAVLGPHFNSTQDLLSDYAPGHWWAHSPLMGAEAMAKAGEISLVGSAQGCDLEGNDTAGFAAATALATAADVPIVFVGLTPNNDKSNSGHPPVVATGSALESEGHDRTNIDFQGQQLPLIRALVGANPKTVVVLIHGGGIDLSWCKDNAAAILDAHYPGQMGGDAIFHSLLNYKGAGPAGRLTTTVYAQDFIARPMSDMSLRNITYKHYLGAPVYPFGYGLSYSKFHVAWASSARVVATVSTDEIRNSHEGYFNARAKGDQTWRSPAAYAATITNCGLLASDFVLLGFVSSPTKLLIDPKEPLRELFDFSRVNLSPNQTTLVHLSVSASVLSRVDEYGDERLQAGQYRIELGGERLGDANSLETLLTVVGDDKMLFSLTTIRAKA